MALQHVGLFLVQPEYRGAAAHGGEAKRFAEKDIHFLLHTLMHPMFSTHCSKKAYSWPEPSGYSLVRSSKH